jgi:hypothetical protein
MFPCPPAARAGRKIHSAVRFTKLMPAVTDRFRELVRILVEDALSPLERTEMKRTLKGSAEARKFLAEALAETTLMTVHGRRLKRGSVRLSS